MELWSRCVWAERRLPSQPQQEVSEYEDYAEYEGDDAGESYKKEFDEGQDDDSSYDDDY